MSQKNRKKILLISYHFPPSTAIGGMRIASFAKYFPAGGWEPSVLTVKDHYLEHQDMDRLDPLKGIPIFKAGKVLTIHDVYLKTKSALCKRRYGNGDKVQSDGGNDGKTAVGQRKRGLIKYFLASFLFLPDEERAWILPAAIQAVRILRQEKIDYILTSCPPYSVHLVGLLVSILRPKVKWIADFRDPWMVPNAKRFYPTTSFSRFVEYRLERFVIQRADLVLTTTKKLTEAFIHYYTQCAADKFKLIPNGFDDEVIALNQRERFDIFTISYTGVLYVGRTPEPVFQAVASLIKKNVVRPSEICIKLVGHCRYVDEVSTVDIVKSYGLDSVVEIIDPVSQKEAQRIIRQSHVALLLAPDQPYQIPAKTYEYLGLGTPILAITGEGATADVINSVPTGKAVHSDNIEAIEKYIVERIKRKEAGFKENRDDLSSKYSRKKPAEKLLQCMQGL